MLHRHAYAADWRPERSVERIVPAAAGSLNDTTMRNLQRVMQALKLVDVPISIVGSTRSTRRFSPSRAWPR
jgi:tripartite-type tricarboxylate transporter receptor subunit TctC